MVNIDINKLRFFAEVCRTNSISHAAENLHITQQGLSASIRRLESELGCDLFYRKNGNIVLTDIGEKVLTECDEIIRHANRIKEICSPSSQGKHRIDLAITESLILRLPATLQMLLINGNDFFDVHLFESYSKKCCDAVEQSDCTFGIVYGQPDEKKFNSVQIDSVQQVIIVNRNNRLAALNTIKISMLDNYPMVVTRKGTYPHKQLEELFLKNHSELKVAYECDRPRQTIDLIANNPLIAARTVAAEISDRDLDRIKVLPVEDEEFQMPVYLICRKNHNLSSSEKIFRKTIFDSYN